VFVAAVTGLRYATAQRLRASTTVLFSIHRAAPVPKVPSAVVSGRLLLFR
jgi:hypothetical protein